MSGVGDLASRSAAVAERRMLIAIGEAKHGAAWRPIGSNDDLFRELISKSIDLGGKSHAFRLGVIESVAGNVVAK